MRRIMNDTRRYELYLDLDGVFADFVRGCKEMLGHTPEEFANAKRKRDMWRGIAHRRDFYQNLKPMPGAKKLWNYCKKFNPTIITGTPNFQHASIGKREWVDRHLGPNIPVICCHSHDKAKLRSKPGAILLDDNDVLTRRPWEELGGTFVHHTDVDSSIFKLKVLLEPQSLNAADFNSAEDPDGGQSSEGSEDLETVEDPGDEEEVKGRK